MRLPTLVVLGNVNLDLGVGPVAPWPVPGSEVLGSEAIYRTGGSAGNAALAGAALGLRVELHAELGDDPLGEWLLKTLQAAGVNCDHVRRRRQMTAFSFSVTHPDGERTFFSFAGHLSTQQIENPEAILASPPGSMVLACGYYLLPRWRDGSLARLLAACQDRGFVTALDTGWPPGAQFDLEELAALLPHTHVFLPNAAEAMALTSTKTVEEAVFHLSRWIPLPVVKDGPRGAWAWDGQEIVHRRTRTSTPRDTVGAGDAFNAALIRALFVDGESLSRALDFANMAALLAITSSPRRYPTFAEVRAELARSAAFAGQDSESGEVSDMDGTLPP